MSYVLGFERYLRRDLTRYERSIIAPLERMRQRGRAVRAMIVDWSDAEDSRPILCAYLRYLHECVFTFPDAMVMAPTYAEGKQLMGYTKEDASWLKIGSGQASDSIRGCTFRMALLLDSDCFDVDEDRAYELQYRAYVAVSGTLLDLPGFVLIIHAHTDCGCRSLPINPELPTPPSRPVKAALPLPPPREKRRWALHAFPLVIFPADTDVRHLWR